MKFRFLQALALVVVATVSVASHAQSIGYVDAVKLIDQAPQGKDEVKLLEQNFSERNRDLKARIDQFNADEADLQKNAVLMSSEELQEKRGQLRERQRSLQREQQIYNEDYARSRNQGLARLEKLISEVIVEIAKQDKVDLVVQQAVYASPGIDLTPKVLERLTEIYGQ